MARTAPTHVDRRTAIRRMAGLALGSALIALAAHPAAAQSAYPERDVRILVNYGAGGSVDRMARSVQSGLADALGQGVTVENVGGAAGKVGLQKFMDMEPDGYTILAAFAPATTVVKNDDPSIFSMDDLAIINVQWVDPAILLARKDTGWTSLEDMIDAAKADPGSLTMASSGKGSVGTILAEELFEAADIDVKMVPYRGGGAARKAIMGGETQMTAAGAAGATAAAEATIPLGVFWHEGVESWPDAEPINGMIDGLTVPEGGAYRFFAVPAAFRDNDPEGFARLVAAFEEVTASEAFRANAAETGVGTDWTGPEEGQALIEEVDAQFTGLLND